MALNVYRKNDVPLAFMHGGVNTSIVFTVNEGSTVDYTVLSEEPVKVSTRENKMEAPRVVGRVTNNGWIQVDHRGESAYCKVKVSGLDRVEVSFDAPPSFIVYKGK